FRVPPGRRPRWERKRSTLGPVSSPGPGLSVVVVRRFCVTTRTYLLSCRRLLVRVDLFGGPLGPAGAPGHVGGHGGTGRSSHFPIGSSPASLPPGPDGTADPVGSEDDDHDEDQPQDRRPPFDVGTEHVLDPG